MQPAAAGKANNVRSMGSMYRMTKPGSITHLEKRKRFRGSSGITMLKLVSVVEGMRSNECPVYNSY